MGKGSNVAKANAARARNAKEQGKKRFAKTIKKAEHRTPLSQVAQQSIQQEIELFDGFGEDKEDFAVFSVALFFQELYVFQLKFTNWRGFNLKVSAWPSRWHCGA